jgi:hypothetical protein
VGTVATKWWLKERVIAMAKNTTDVLLDLGGITWTVDFFRQQAGLQYSMNIILASVI